MTVYADLSEKEAKHIHDRREDIYGRVKIGVNYHRKREWLFDFLQKSTTAIAVISATSALAAIYDEGSCTYKAIQILIVVSSTVSLVFDWPNKARVHSDLAGKYARMDKSISDLGDRKYSEDDVSKWFADMAEIEASEPPVLPGLIQLVQDEIDAAKGEEVEADRLTFGRRFKAHLGFGYIVPKKIPSPNSEQGNAVA